MKKALIGFSGFVGSNILIQDTFDDLYNSKNIKDIEGKSYDIIYCAGVYAAKWIANSKPEEDLINIVGLINSLRQVNASKFVLISTVDVYSSPFNVDEDTKINLFNNHPYGVNRRLLELFIEDNFEDHSIIRLPGLFGNGLKKNVIYDFINNNQIDKINSESQFQFYYLKNIVQDINIILNKKIKLINLVTEPIKVKELASYCFEVDFINIKKSGTAKYNVTSKYSEFHKSKVEVLNQIKDFLNSIL